MQHGTRVVGDCVANGIFLFGSSNSYAVLAITRMFFCDCNIRPLMMILHPWSCKSYLHISFRDFFQIISWWSSSRKRFFNRFCDEFSHELAELMDIGPSRSEHISQQPAPICVCASQWASHTEASLFDFEAVDSKASSVRQSLKKTIKSPGEEKAGSVSHRRRGDTSWVRRSTLEKEATNKRRRQGRVAESKVWKMGRAGERGNVCGNLFKESLEREVPWNSPNLWKRSQWSWHVRPAGGGGVNVWGARESREGWGGVEISGVFVNADVHIAGLPHIFLRESVFPSRLFNVYPVI